MTHIIAAACNMDSGAKVYEGIYIGSLATATNKYWLDQHKITAIINLSGTSYRCDRPVLSIDMQDADVTMDTIDDYCSKFAIGTAAIEKCRQCGHTVLVHCAAGINRSATLIGFYLIECGLTYKEVLSALETANSIRGVAVLTNYTFRMLLQIHDSFRRNFSCRQSMAPDPPLPTPVFAQEKSMTYAQAVMGPLTQKIDMCYFEDSVPRDPLYC